MRLNGVDIEPHPGAAVGLIPNQNFVVISSNATMCVRGIPPIEDGIIILDPPTSPRGAPPVASTSTTTRSPRRPTAIGIGGLPFDGSIGLDLTYHRAELPVHVTLPDVFSLSPEDSDPIDAVTWTLSTDNTGGYQVDKVHIGVPEAFLGILEVDNLFFDYQRDGDIWDGGADLAFPGFGERCCTPSRHRPTTASA